MAARSRRLLCEEGAPSGRVPDGADRIEIARGLLERRAPADRGGLAAPASDGRSADWITDREQGAGPLLARVMVNRVWQHHFGEGLVRTVSDFGVRGERPTHPELAGVARPRVCGGRLADQASASRHRHERSLHAGYDIRCGTAQRRTLTIVCYGGAGRSDWRPRSCVMPCCP